MLKTKTLLSKVACAFALVASTAAAAPPGHLTPPAVLYNVEVLRVVDGDTVAIRANYLPKPLKPELLLRIDGIDTPEKGSWAKCSREKTQSLDATRFTTQLVNCYALKSIASFFINTNQRTNSYISINRLCVSKGTMGSSCPVNINSCI